MSPTKLLKSAAIPFAALCLAPLSCLAQGSPTTIEVIAETPKPDMTAKFEQGVKAVDAYAQSHGDTEGSETFEVLDGPQKGTIFVLSEFRWAERDHTPSYAAGLERVITQQVLPYLSSPYQLSLMQTIPGIGTAAPANAPPEKYYELLHLLIKPDRMGDFLAAVTQISAAEHKENPQASNPVLFYREASGGNGSEITVAIGHPTLADFARPGKSIDEALREAYGEDVAISVRNSLNASIQSENDDIALYRPDLSFTPGAQGK